MMNAAAFITTVMSLQVYCNYILYPGQETAVVPWIYTVWLVLGAASITAAHFSRRLHYYVARGKIQFATNVVVCFTFSHPM